MAWLDNARILAILAVVMLHVAADFVFELKVGDTEWWIANLYDSAVRWCVPVFVMISGALLLDPTKSESLETFYRKRVSRLLIPLVFWTMVYLGWQVVKGKIKHQPETISSLLTDLLNGQPYYHLWFLYMIIGLYIFTPFFRMIVIQATERSLWFLSFAGLTFAAINSLHTKLNGLSEGLFINWFLLYVPYFFLGFLLRKTTYYPSPKFVLSAFTASVCLTAFGFYFLAESAGKTAGLYFYDYLSISVIPMSVCVMFMFKKRNLPIWDNKKTKLLASLTLGVYLLHPMVLEVLNFAGVGAMAFPAIISIPIVTLVVYLCSLIGAWVLSRLPGLRHCI